MICNMLPNLFGWSVGLSLFPKKGGKLHFHAPIEALSSSFRIKTKFKQVYSNETLPKNHSQKPTNNPRVTQKINNFQAILSHRFSIG